MPFFIAEGYINFGIMGVILFMLILGITLSKIDKIFWHNSSLNPFSAHSILYKLILEWFFFVMRGDLLSSFAYTIGLIISFYITYFFVIKSYRDEMITYPCNLMYRFAILFL